MSLLCEIDDKGATTAWCPLKGRASLLAVGSKDAAAGGNFEDYGGELVVYSMDFTQEKVTPKIMGKVETTQPFGCLAWGPKGPSNAGILAGGMQNGVVQIWDPKSLPKAAQAGGAAPAAGQGQPLCKVEKHKSKVNCLQFNPHPSRSNLLATGASDNEVYIIDLNVPNTPKLYQGSSQKHSNEVRAVAWNPEFADVLATAGLDGECKVFKFGQDKSVQIREPRGYGFTSIAWLTGWHLLVANTDDRDPVLRIYDRRASFEQPYGEYRGHTGGIISISCCPSDPSFVMSCGKDGRTLLWDFQTGQNVFELPGSKPQHAVGHGGLGPSPGLGGGLFGGNNAGGGGGWESAQAGKRYHVQFAPHDRGVFATCSLDRKVSIFSMNGGAGSGAIAAASATQGNYPMRAPGWFSKRACGASFGFGGRLVNFGNPQAAPPATNGVDAGLAELKALRQGPKLGNVRLSRYSDGELMDIAERAVDWDNRLSNTLAADAQLQQERVAQGTYDPNAGTLCDGLIELCANKAAAASTRAEKETWGFMKILFEPSARDKILEALGFDMSSIKQLVSSLDTRAAAAAAAVAEEAARVEQMHLEESRRLQEQQQMQVQAQKQQAMTPQRNLFAAPSNGGGSDDFFDTMETKAAESAAAPASPPQSPQQTSSAPTPASPQPRPKESSQKPKDIAVEDAEVRDPSVDEIISKALLVANFPVAVDCCLENNRFADALLLSSCGGRDLYNETINKYLERFYSKKAYVPVLAAVMNSDLRNFVARSAITGNRWKEVLAVVSQYGSAEEIPSLFEALAARLSLERAGEEEAQVAACLCYLCARNVEETVRHFIKLCGKEIANKPLELSLLITEKTSVYQHALQPESQELMMSNPDVMNHLLNLADALASQGLFPYAAKYVAAVNTTLFQGKAQVVGVDQYTGAPIEQMVLGESELAHNHQAQRALELGDRLYGSAPQPETLEGYLTRRGLPFQVQNIGIAPVEQAPAPMVQQQQQQQQQQPQQNGIYAAQNGYAQQPQQQPLAHFNSAGSGSFPANKYSAPAPAYNAPAPAYNAPAPAYNAPAPAYNAPAPAAYSAPAPAAYSAPAPQPYSNQSTGYPRAAAAPAPVYHPQEQPAAAGFARSSLPPVRSGASDNKPYVKENDGFGSTAGNPMAGQKYGNLPPGAASQPFAAAVPQVNSNVATPWGTQQPQQQVPAQPPVQEKPRVMPPAMAKDVSDLEHHVQRLVQVMQDPVGKKKAQDAVKCVESLKDKLMTGECGQELFAEVSALLRAIVHGDTVAANNTRTALTQRPQVWAEQKDWLRGMTSLVLISKRS